MERFHASEKRIRHVSFQQRYIPVYRNLISPPSRQATGAGPDASDGQIMNLLRELKNNFRG